MNEAIVKAFGEIDIFAKVQLMQDPVDLTARERRRGGEAITGDIRKLTDLEPASATHAGAERAHKLGVDLEGKGWHDQSVFDPGRELFLLEHVIPVKAIRDVCLEATSEAEVESCLAATRTAWVTREEDEALTMLGYRSVRPDPRAAYEEAGISLAGLTRPV